MYTEIIDLQSADGARARVHTHGGHVLSWHPADDAGDRLFMSPLSQAGPDIALRGGVPVVFPQFAKRGPLPKHGFARTLPWTLRSNGRGQDGKAFAVLELRDSSVTRAQWPHEFRIELQVSIGGAGLDLALRIDNTGTGAFECMAAFHTYFRVGDIAAARVTGLQGTRRGDFVADPRNGAPGIEDDAQLAIPGHFDTIFWNAPEELLLREGERRIAIRQRGFCDTVIWNPGPEHVHDFPDLRPGDQQHFLCIEAARVGLPITLEAGASWHGAQHLHAG